jgi:hypothetical protein
VINVTQDLSRFENPIHRGMNALALLKQSGVPVIGVVYPEAVEWGSLTVSAPDLVDGTVTWSWSERAGRST